MGHRIERINSLIRKEISELLQREIKDPRLDSFIVVTEVETSPDLRYAKVFVSRIGTEGEKKDTLSGLAAASGFFRNELAKHLGLRRVPQLAFEWDNSIERGSRIMDLIDQVSSDGSPDEHNG